MHLLINFLIFVVGQMNSAIKISIIFLYKSHNASSIFSSCVLFKVERDLKGGLCYGLTESL